MKNKPICPKCRTLNLVRSCQRNGIWGWHCWGCGEIFFKEKEVDEKSVEYLDRKKLGIGIKKGDKK